MLPALILRSVVPGAYLTALVFHGVATLVAALVAVAMVLIWAAPLARDAVRRRRERQTSALAAP
jgi:Flp pilus assembly protein TadB